MARESKGKSLIKITPHWLARLYDGKAGAVLLLLVSLFFPFHNVNAESYALELFQEVAEKGDARAQSILGSLYYYGVGLPQSEAKAFQWYRAAAEGGEGLAQFNLGVMYYNGEGTNRNRYEALKWFHKVSDQGMQLDETVPDVVSWAQLKLGFMYHDGKVTAPNDVEALYWFRRAADRGVPLAQYMLGQMFHKGRGAPQDAVRAFMWYELATLSGNKEAKQGRSQILDQLTPGQIDQGRQMTEEWYRNTGNKRVN
ncbi:MAG: sel1 repeat family protein [Magnetococcales bacterium]|nr:sel1 repeat family protein [Magnetococcales bacterium]